MAAGSGKTSVAPVITADKSRTRLRTDRVSAHPVAGRRIASASTGSVGHRDAGSSLWPSGGTRRVGYSALGSARPWAMAPSRCVVPPSETRQHRMHRAEGRAPVTRKALGIGNHVSTVGGIGRIQGDIGRAVLSTASTRRSGRARALHWMAIGRSRASGANRAAPASPLPELRIGQGFLVEQHRRQVRVLHA